MLLLAFCESSVLAIEKWEPLELYLGDSTEVTFSEVDGLHLSRKGLIDIFPAGNRLDTWTLVGLKTGVTVITATTKRNTIKLIVETKSRNARNVHSSKAYRRKAVCSLKNATCDQNMRKMVFFIQNESDMIRFNDVCDSELGWVSCRNRFQLDSQTLESVRLSLSKYLVGFVVKHVSSSGSATILPNNLVVCGSEKGRRELLGLALGALPPELKSLHFTLGCSQKTHVRIKIFLELHSDSTGRIHDSIAPQMNSPDLNNRLLSQKSLNTASQVLAEPEFSHLADESEAHFSIGSMGQKQTQVDALSELPQGMEVGIKVFYLDGNEVGIKVNGTINMASGSGQQVSAKISASNYIHLNKKKEIGHGKTVSSSETKKTFDFLANVPIMGPWFEAAQEVSQSKDFSISILVSR